MKEKEIYLILALFFLLAVSCKDFKNEFENNKPNSFTVGMTVFGGYDDPVSSFMIISFKNENRDTLYFKTYLKSVKSFNNKALTSDSNFTKKIIISKNKSDSIRQSICNIIYSPIIYKNQDIKDGAKINFYYGSGDESISHSFSGNKIESKDFTNLLSLLNFKLE